VFVARRFVFFDFNLKTEALILAALGLRWPRVRGNEKWRKRFFVYQISDSLTQIIRITRGTPGRSGRPQSHATIILLAAGDRDVLPTIREQKHLLHHRSGCRYRHRPQSAPRVLAQG
jgi:hypothetical protein